MKRKISSLLFLIALVFSSTVWAVDKSSETSKGDVPAGIKEELKEIQKELKKEFSYDFPETPGDVAEIKKAVLVLTKASHHMDDSKTVRVYWKKTKLKDTDGTLKKGYLFLVLNKSSRLGDFATFWEGQKVTDVLDMGMKGYLEIKNKNTKCLDCEGGLWSQSYIHYAAEKLLLKEKYFEMELVR